MGAAPQISPNERVAEFRKTFARAEAEVGRVIVGHRDVIRKVLTALFCGGHILIEGVPGLGKTLMVKTTADVLGLSFKRIQFTPDLMPSDIVGTQVLTESEGRREFQFQGRTDFRPRRARRRNQPRDAQDPIGRARSDGRAAGHRVRHDLSARPPFFVLATQNPIELEGTYPLPEAQMDRFLFKVVMGAPKPDELREILDPHHRRGHV